MFDMIDEKLKEKFYSSKEVLELLPLIEKELHPQKISSYAAAEKLLNVYFSSLKIK